MIGWLRVTRPRRRADAAAGPSAGPRLGALALAAVPILVGGAFLGPSSTAADSPPSQLRTAPDGAEVQQVGTTVGPEPWWQPFVPGLAMAEGESSLGDLFALGAPGSGVAGPAGSASSEDGAGGGSGARAGSGGAVPAPTLAAYRRAAERLRVVDPSCGLEWTLLAGIGRVESNHGRFGGAVVGSDGVSSPPVIGVRLDGSLAETMVVRDSDSGALDGDSRYDRAVGPMQFLPGTWRTFGADGDGDGRKNPQDIDDAALASAAYLCSGSGTLTTPAGARAAVLRYNNSGEYADLVLALAAVYEGLPTSGLVPVSGAPADVPLGPATPQRPASPGEPLGVERPARAPAAVADTGGPPAAPVVAAGGQPPVAGADGAPPPGPPAGEPPPDSAPGGSPVDPGPDAPPGPGSDDSGPDGSEPGDGEPTDAGSTVTATEPVLPPCEPEPEASATESGEPEPSSTLPSGSGPNASGPGAGGLEGGGSSAGSSAAGRPNAGGPGAGEPSEGMPSEGMPGPGEPSGTEPSQPEPTCEPPPVAPEPGATPMAALVPIARPGAQLGLLLALGVLAVLAPHLWLARATWPAAGRRLARGSRPAPGSCPAPGSPLARGPAGDSRGPARGEVSRRGKRRA